VSPTRILVVVAVEEVVETLLQEGHMARAGGG